MAGANCGACGCAGCADYAKSIVENGNAINKSYPGGAKSVAAYRGDHGCAG
ncbi:MAG: (Fe-S)-binding protein [Oscillospiraceae bacterium]